MKHINEDPILQVKSQVLNDLNKKKTEVDFEVATLEKRLSDFHAMNKVANPIEDALNIEVGVPPTHALSGDQSKLSLLRQQSDKLRQAITIQHEAVYNESRIAGNRVFALNHNLYMKHCSELINAIDKVIEINAKVAIEYRSLLERGCIDLPEILFPGYGLHDQVHVWKNNLEEMIDALSRTVTHYGPDSSIGKSKAFNLSKERNIKVRILGPVWIDGVQHNPNDIATLSEYEVSEYRGSIDANPEAVKQAEAIRQNKDRAQKLEPIDPKKARIL